MYGMRVENPKPGDDNYSLVFDCFDTAEKALLFTVVLLPLIIVMSPFFVLGYILIKTGIRDWFKEKIDKI